MVDQLEEVFTLVEDEEQRARFLEVLERAVADPRSRLRIVTTLRADFYDRPLLYSGFADLLRDYVEALVPLTPDEFERAIAGPANRAGVSLEAGLLAEMVTDVATEPGALPLLQYALTELYERREGTILTRAAYHDIGGVSGALAGRAEEVFAGLTAEAQEGARQLFLRLVALGEGAEDTRRRVDRAELAAMEVDQEAVNESIDAFGSSRLLSFDRDPRTGAPTIEVAHEALLREWARLRRWIDSAREDVRLHRRLAAAAREWDDSDRDSSFLLRGGHLAQFESWAADSRVALTGVEREFVDTSVAESRRELLRERRQNRRLKILLAGAGALLALAVAAGIVALLQRQSAKHEATLALARQLGAQSVIEPRIDRSMLLAREAVNLDGSTQTQGALLSTLLRSPAAIGTFPFPIEARPLTAAVTPDGRTLAVTDNQQADPVLRHAQSPRGTRPAEARGRVLHPQLLQRRVAPDYGRRRGAVPEPRNPRRADAEARPSAAARAPADRGPDDSERSVRADTRRQDVLPRLRAARRRTVATVLHTSTAGIFEAGNETVFHSGRTASSAWLSFVMAASSRR